MKQVDQKKYLGERWGRHNPLHPSMKSSSWKCNVKPSMSLNFQNDFQLERDFLMDRYGLIVFLLALAVNSETGKFFVILVTCLFIQLGTLVIKLLG